MKRRIAFIVALSLLLPAGHAAMAETGGSHWPAGAKVFFVEPKNGAEISGPVKVVMGVEGIEIAPAGTEAPHTGHHHILSTRMRRRARRRKSRCRRTIITSISARARRRRR